MKNRLIFSLIFVCLIKIAFGQKDITDSSNIEEISSPYIDTISYFSFDCNGMIKNCLIAKEKKYYSIRLIDSIGKTKEGSYNIEPDFNDKDLAAWLNNLNMECKEKTDFLVYKIRQKVNSSIDSERKKGDLKTIDSIASEFEKEIIAGELFNSSKNVPIYNLNSNAFLRMKPIKDTMFVINTIRTQIDYNRIYDLTVEGFLLMVNPVNNRSSKLPMVLNNNDFSLSFIGLNNGWYILKLPVLQQHSLFINFADIIQYKPSRKEFSAIVRNQTSQITTRSSSKILKRSFVDYVSFRTFLDPLGFLGKNPNGFAKLEGDAILPLRLINYKRRNILPQATFNFGYIYSNSINSEPRIAPVYLLKNNNLSTLGDDTSRFVNNIEIIKYAYYQFNTRVSLFALECKKMNSWIHFESGFRVAGAKVGDSLKNKIIHKFMPEAQVRVEIRPDYVIGASISLGVSWLGNSHRGNNSPYNINDISFLYKSKITIPHECNVYAMTGNGNGGLFFRYTGWLSFNKNLSKSIDTSNLPPNSEEKKTSYFPQILIGYSTNIGALIKRTGKERVYY